MTNEMTREDEELALKELYQDNESEKFTPTEADFLLMEIDQFYDKENQTLPEDIMEEIKDYLRKRIWRK